MPNIMINENKLCLKTIYELLGENFYIPAYQRGYRWSEIQVKELLNDIWEFSQKDHYDKEEFYCLQPVVVAENDEKWEIVDGQQRLTTIYIILHYLEKEHLRRSLAEAFSLPIFSLHYETRPDSSAYLQNLSQEQKHDNIDYYHISEAYKVVCQWFSELDYNDKDSFLKVLLAKPNKNEEKKKSNSVQVIWYDLTDECVDNDYAIDVFSRINIGKIPLTNAELIKALFLQSSHFCSGNADLKQLQIATEWDFIEKSLQQPDFWHFIYNSNSGRSYDTRIEYIFDLMKETPAGAEPFFTFHKFSDDFKSSEEQIDIDNLWKRVKDYFLTFDEWYRDRELYHLIGFLVNSDMDIIPKIKLESQKMDVTKTSFKSYLKDQIRQIVKCQIDQLQYGDKKIREVLLLFNIQTLLSTQEADVRFPFDRYKKENWDIEHIKSQTDVELSGKAQEKWAEDILEYWTGSKELVNTSQCLDSDDKQEIITELRDFLTPEKVKQVSFKELYEKVNVIFDINKEFDTHNIGNLALLDETTNRSYKNAMFPIKRKHIIANDMNGVFVPICTKNVFLKFYSKTPGDLLVWSDEDASDYLNAIKEILKEYLPEQGRS